MAAANLQELIEKLPHGLQTALGEGGALVSGGEGQRVRLARALLRPEVRLVILDEPFRGLDRDTRHRLMMFVREHWREATLVCVSHDVAETQDFDRVLVVDAGAIVEDGDPRELANADSRYRALLSDRARCAGAIVVEPGLAASARRRGAARRGAIAE